MAQTIHAFQIYYDAATRARLDPDFEALDNTANERPDWFEYWPIRKYLAAHSQDDTCYYGFLSPNFHAKTLLTGRQVRAFVGRAGAADVVTFSPLPCHAACFLNVFEQAEFTQPGFMRVMAAYLRETESAVALETMVNHCGDTVFSNFFLARPSFWRRWSAAAERLFGMAENSSSPLHALLNQETPYVKDDGVARPAQQKVFVMERIVTLLLATSRDLAVVNYPPFELPLAPYFAALRTEVMRLDALKLAYAKSGDAALLREYRALQEKTIAAAQRNLGQA
jgi:hypothetical protein